MDHYRILLDILKDIEKFEDINDFEKLDDVYLRRECVSILKQFLTLGENYKSIPYKIISISLMYNWMLTHHKKINLFVNRHPKFKNVLEWKLNEYGNDYRVINCKYWKGIDVYEKHLLKN